MLKTITFSAPTPLTLELKSHRTSAQIDDTIYDAEGFMPTKISPIVDAAFQETAHLHTYALEAHDKPYQSPYMYVRHW